MHLIRTVESTEFDNNMLNKKKLALNGEKVCLQPRDAKKPRNYMVFGQNGQFNP